MSNALKDLVYELYDIAAEMGVELPLTIEESLIISNIEAVAELTARTLAELSSRYRKSYHTGHISTVFSAPQPCPPAEFLRCRDLWNGINTQILIDSWNLRRRISSLSVIPKQFGGVVHLYSDKGMDYYEVIIRTPDCPQRLLPILRYGINTNQFVEHVVQMITKLLHAVINAAKRINSGTCHRDVSEDLYITMAYISSTCNYARAVMDTCNVQSPADLCVIPSLVRHTDNAATALESMLEQTAIAISRLAKELLLWKEEADEFLHKLELCTEALQQVTDTIKRELESYAMECSKLTFWDEFVRLNYPEYYEEFFGE